MKTRESNYDILRVICAFSVVLVHVCAIYVRAYSSQIVFGVRYTDHIFSTCLYDTLPRYFVIPCFVMLSGAFLLSDDRNSDYRSFYKKSFGTIVIPTAVFSILYFLYANVKNIYEYIDKGTDVSWFSPVISLIKGAPFYHMWYMYMLIGLYLLVPILVRIKKDIGEQMFAKVGITFFVVACISGYTSEHILNWDVGFIISFLGYFVLGYLIRKRCLERKHNGKACLWLVGSVIIAFINSCLYYRQLVYGRSIFEKHIGYDNFFFPLVVIAAIMFFIGFSKMNLNVKLGRLPNLTFYIYLIHAVVWDVGTKIVAKWCGIHADSRIVIIVASVIVFGLSWLLSKIYLRIWNKIETRFCITQRISQKIWKPEETKV